MIFTWVYFLILVELFVVSLVDIKKSRISNYWFFINLILGISFYIIPGGDYAWSWEVLIFPVGFIVVGFLLFLVNIMGAGDSKFLTSLFLVVPLKYHQYLFDRIVITTLVIGVIILIISLLREREKIQAFAINRYWKGAFLSLKSRFSYAPVIFIAWLSLGMFIWL